MSEHRIRECKVCGDDHCCIVEARKDHRQIVFIPQEPRERPWEYVLGPEEVEG